MINAMTYETAAQTVKSAVERKSYMKAWIRRLPSWTDVFVDDVQTGCNLGHVTIYPTVEGGSVVRVYGPWARNIDGALHDAGIPAREG